MLFKKKDFFNTCLERLIAAEKEARTSKIR